MLVLAMKRMMQSAWAFAREVVAKWGHDHVALMAGGVTFYAIFSIVPLLSLIMAAASIFVGRASAHEQLAGSVAQFVTPRTAAAIAGIASSIRTERSSGVTIVSAILLIFGASSVFDHLRTGLNIVLNVPDGGKVGWLRLALSRLVSIVMVVGVMIFLLISVALTASLALIRRFLPDLPIANGTLWHLVDAGFAAILLAVLVALALRYVPDVRLPWSSIARGSITSAILFSLGRYGLALYLAHAQVLGAYGAAGSLFIVLVAVFLAVLVLFAGAEVAEIAASSDDAFVRERASCQERVGPASGKAGSSAV